VHSLLEEVGRHSNDHGHHGLDGAGHSKAQQRRGKQPQPKRMGEDMEPQVRVAPQAVDAAADQYTHEVTSGTVTPNKGQEDEQAWRERLAGASSELSRSNTGTESLMMGVPIVDVNAESKETHSRLLTKRQLSDMAWGVRELSKRLGSVKLKLKVRTVFLLTKAHDESLIWNTREMARWLLSTERDVRYVVYVEDRLKENKKFGAESILEELRAQESNGERISNGDRGLKTRNERRLRYWNEQMCRARPHTFDFVVTLGGDGTVLYASWLFQRIVPPVLSFALGSLGFLTKFDYEDFATTLDKAFKEGVKVALRLRFEGTIMRSQPRKKKIKGVDGDGSENEVEVVERRDLVEELIGEETEDETTHKPMVTYEILNDIVVDRGPNPSIFPFFSSFVYKVSLFMNLLPPLSFLKYLTFPYLSLTDPSNVFYRALWRRRTLHLNPSRRNLRLYPHRLDCLQPGGWWITLSPRKPNYSRNSNLCTYAVLPPHHPPRHDRAPRRRSL
jgi:NAD kinase